MECINVGDRAPWAQLVEFRTETENPSWEAEAGTLITPASALLGRAVSVATPAVTARWI